MEGVIVKENTLLDSEKQFLEEICVNFVATSTPEENHNYFKQTIEADSNLSSFLTICKEQLINFGFTNEKRLELGEVWVNKVNDETNQKDSYHFDINELTSVTFLNEDFEGGFLEIQTKDGITKVEPKIGKTIFFQGSKLSHKVLPVKNGIRYTMVTFWNWISKNEKTLM